MAVNEKIADSLRSARAWLNEQQWYQEAKAKWDELDEQSRNNLKIGAAGGAVLLVLFSLYSVISGVYELKSQLAERTELLTLLRSANDEMRVLKQSGKVSSSPVMADKEDKKFDWEQHFGSIATTAGVGKDNLEVASGKSLKGTEISKEDLFDISLKKVNIKQVVRYAYYLETGSQPVKLRNLSIDTLDDKGYLDAKLVVSAFTIKSK